MNPHRQSVLCCLIAVLVLLPQGLAGGGEAPREASRPQPHFILREHLSTYTGAGHDVPEPEEFDEVPIAFFGPGDPADPIAGDLWSAAQMGIEEANAEGGLRGRPFRLIPAWSDDPWGDGAAELARLVYDEPIWAILGSIDGHTAHLAAQVVTTARLPLLSPASGDKTVNLANVPWVYSLLPGDHLQAPVLAEALAEALEGGRLVVLSAGSHDARHFTRDLLAQLRGRRITPRAHVTFREGTADLSEHVRFALEARPDVVALLADAADSARLVRAVREAGFEGTVFGSATIGRRRFLAEAGEAAEGVVFPLLFEPSESARDFAAAFEARCGYPPDYAAAHTYDAARLLVAAVRSAGLNRARINDAIRELAPFAGVTGTIDWDPLGDNTRPVVPATMRNGRPQPWPEPRSD